MSTSGSTRKPWARVLRWARGRREVFEADPEHFEPAIESAPGDPPQTRMLHLFGRDPE